MTFTMTNTSTLRHVVCSLETLWLTSKQTIKEMKVLTSGSQSYVETYQMVSCWSRARSRSASPTGNSSDQPTGTKLLWTDTALKRSRPALPLVLIFLGLCQCSVGALVQNLLRRSYSLSQGGEWNESSDLWANYRVMTVLTICAYLQDFVTHVKKILCMIYSFSVWEGKNCS